ncbi:MAG: elongation factor P [Kosmotoga sp.]|uniref:elongation factor P n=1 Tax=Kosmotoga sp. TaxID=1955248 RepID=UPI001DE363D3|nr:elongation factor P [Kosmotoga sp.]
MLEVGDIRKGIALIVDNDIYIVLDVNKHFTGRGSGIIRTKMKNIKTGYVREFKFNSGEKVEEASLSLRHVQYLYNDGNLYYFMDLETYEQYALDKEVVGDAIYYMTENMELDLQFHDSTPIGVVLPNTVVLEVTDTAPSYKGDTVSGGGKPAVCETGLKITVPFFVENGQKVRVDTRTGEYIERA